MEARRDGAGIDPSWEPPTADASTSVERELTEALARSRARFDQSPLPQALLDVEGRFKEVNDAACELLGWSRAELLGREATELVHPADPAQARHELQRLREGARSASWETTALRRDTSEFPLHLTVTAVRDRHGQVCEFAALARDLRDLHEAERRLLSQEVFFRGLAGDTGDTADTAGAYPGDTAGSLLYAAIAETAQEGILAVSPSGDILFVNRKLTEIVGLSMREVYALGGQGMFAPAEAAEAARRLATRRRREAGPERSDLRYRHPDGSDRVLHVSASALTAADGSVLGSLAMVADVTEQRAAEESLRRQALHDPLTGLPNRLLFVDRLGTAVARQDRAPGDGIAVLFLDVDHFKAVNDTYGHQAGDLLLVEVAARLAGAVRAADTVARLGGDEFAVICEAADGRTADLVASRVQEALKEPVVVEGQERQVSMSIGVALSPPHAPQDLLRFADMAMYQAKATSDGGVVTYDGPSQEPAGSGARRTTEGDRTR